MTNVLALPTGTELVGDYRIERVLGAGGFGMTYLAEEIALARQVTIKEYFPTEFAARGDGLAAVPREADATSDFQWGLDRFIDEAQTLARFDHPHIVRVFRYFKANGTGYMVLTFEEGQSLKAWLRTLGRAPRQRELDDILRPLLDALEVIHAADFLHRDIAPDNIIIRRDGSPVLIDFGSARGDIARHSRTISALVKPGYSPYEQYAESGTRQGPWTDIYALGATLYHAIGGKRPPDAPSRVVRDEMMPAGDIALATYRQRFLAAIDRALVLEPESRPQSVAGWRGDLLAPDPARPSWLQRATGRAAARSDSAAEPRTLPITRADGPLPPPPDAPGAPGQMLDYIDGLRQRIDPPPHQAAPATDGRASTAASDANEAATSSVAPHKPTTASKSNAKPAEKLPVPVPQRTKPPRPRPNSLRGGRQWRSFALKFLLGAGIAGSAIAFKDRMPDFSAAEPRSTAGTARIIARETARISMLPGHRGGTTSVGFTGDGRTVVTAGADRTLKVWNAATGASLRTIEPEEGTPTAMAVWGRRVLTGHADGRLVLWDIDSGARLASLRHNTAAITAVGFAQDGSRLVASSTDATLAVWAPESPQQPAAFIEAHDGPINAVAQSGRGPFIATGGDDRTVRLWRSHDLRLVRSYRGLREPVTALAFSPDGRHLAAAAEDGRIRIWSTSSSSLYRISSTHKGPVKGLAFSPAGDVIASAGEDGSVQLWAIRQSRSVRALAEKGIPAHALAFAPDGSRAAVASADGLVRFWDAPPPGRSARQ